MLDWSLLILYWLYDEVTNLFMIFDLFKKPKIVVHAGKIRPVVLVVLDGWGIAPPGSGNAITLANPQNFNFYWDNYPHSQLLAAGEAVGLPAEEVGNTEVGHLSMGAGRVILQSLRRIDRAIEDGSFFENKAFYHALFHSQKSNSKLHLIGLVSSGHVHASAQHLYALLDFLRRNKATNVYLHVFTDGRDALPKDGINVIRKLEQYLESNNIGKIATISGRYWAMDRDRRWDRIQKTYEAMVKGDGPTYQNVTEAINASYGNNVTDEFIVPSVIDKNGLIGNNDAVIFFNYRIDRPRELTMSLVVKDFKSSNISWEFDPFATKYERKRGALTDTNFITTEPFSRGNIPSNLYFVTMTQYQANLPISEVAFPPEEIVDCLPIVLSKNGLMQMHMAESEKERFVTYYFDGLREDRQTGEEVVIVPSPRVATYDKKPEMSVKELAEEFKRVLNQDKYQFILINIANPDMVAHSGNLQATLKAIGHVDNALKEIVEGVLSCDGTVLITGDHGNAEEMVTYSSSSFFFTSSQGKMNTNHSSNPVPLIVVNKAFNKTNKKLGNGGLSDIAPTILSLIGIEIPPVMTGKNLIS